MKDNAILKKVFEADQQARKLAPDDPAEFNSYWSKVSKADEERRQKVERLVTEGKVKTQLDFYHAAMIFQHGMSESDFKRARDYAKTAMDMGLEEARWLYATATDRLLRIQGKKQKFGTQYEWVVLKEGDKYYDAMLLQPYDKRTTDATRSKYNIPPLAELKKQETKKLRK